MADHQSGTGTSESLTPASGASLFEQFVTDDESENDEGLDSNDTDDEGSEHEVGGEESEDAGETDDDVVEGDDGDGEEEQDAPVVPASRKLKVKLPDGEQELPEDEVVKGYLRTADYTRKTQAVAEKDRALEAEREQVRGERQQYASRLTALDEALKAQSPAEPDWDRLRQENPAEFPTVWADWQRHQSRLAKVAEARRLAVEAVTNDQIEHTKRFLESENTKLHDAIPTWKDEAIAKKEKTELHKFALDAGYTESELNQVYDHRVMVLLRKAMLYDKGVAKKPAAAAKIEKVRVATPGPANSAANKAPVTERKKLTQRLARSGRVRDAAALMEAFV